MESPFAPLKLKMGEPCDKRLQLVPYKLVQRYPYMYVGKANQEEVAGFFKATMLENRVWDILCMRDPNGARDPLLLVPSAQFTQYLNIANHQLDKSLCIPEGKANENFFVTFGDCETPLPLFLGRINSLESLEALQGRVNSLPADDFSRATPAALQLFQDRLDTVYKSLRPPKSKKNPEIARQKRLKRQKEYSRMIKRAQKYLGLRKRTAYATSFNASDQAIGDYNENEVVPFKPKESVRFVCVDIEAYEGNANMVTEVGIAVLDTEDTIDVPHGENGVNWYQLIEAHHLRVSERTYMVNHKYVHGCPDAFDFGQSKLVPINEINKVVGQIIGDRQSEDKRPVILVGHDIMMDMKYLKIVGYNVWRVPQIIDEMDTKDMFSRLEESPDGRGLETVCNALGLFGKNFHNAGNDAVYTLQAMIATVIQKKTGRRTSSITMTGDDAEWTDGDLDDGGAPKRSDPPVEQTTSSQHSKTPQEPRW